MDNFSYCTPTKYIFGTQAETQVGTETAALGAKTVLLVSGHSSARRSGLLDRVEQSLASQGIKTINLDGIDPNPTDPKVREGIELCRQNNVEAIIAVGGGSVIDTAKAIAAGAPYDGDFWDFWAGRATITYALPVGVVLTIPAAGSEGSGNSVITLEATQAKISLRTDYWLRPRFALLNPELTYSLPPYQTAAGIVDMMAHILERYFTPTQGTETTDRISEGLLMAIMDQARIVMAQPTNYDARANIMWSATLAHNGICGCGKREDWSSHGLEHELSAIYGVTHGAGLAVVFPAYITYVARKNPTRPAQLAHRVLGVPPTESPLADALVGVARLKRFFTEIGMPTTLAGLGIDTPDIPLLTERFHLHKGNPTGAYIPLSPTDTTQIYQLMSD